MKRTMAAIAATLMIMVSSCGPTADEIATMTASAWTPTPVPTPTATPIPYDLTVHVMDGSGAPVPGTNGVTLETGGQAPLQADASGKLEWKGLPGPTANITVSAPGYFPASQSVAMDRGLTELALILQRDPSGLTTADACAPDEKLLYTEDFQDGKAQGWKQTLGDPSAWSIVTLEEGNQVASISGGGETGAELEGFVFDNVVWRLRVQAGGSDGSALLNLKQSHAGSGTRYVIHWSAQQSLALTHFDVAYENVLGQTGFRPKTGKWYYVEISAYQGLIQVWVNGQKQVAAQDPNPLPPGTISLGVQGIQDPKTAFHFDNISVCELNASFATSLYKPPAP